MGMLTGSGAKIGLLILRSSWPSWGGAKVGWLAHAQLMSELVRKAEQSIDALAAKLRSGGYGGAAGGNEPAAVQHALPSALSGSCPQQQQQQAAPAVPVDALINAARDSVQQIAGAGPGGPPA
jgi:hypothetical protein